MLKKEDLSQAMDALDDDMIEETDALRKKPQRKHPRLPAWIYAAAAAVLLIVSLGVFQIIGKNIASVTDPTDIPENSGGIYTSVEPDASHEESTKDSSVPSADDDFPVLHDICVTVRDIRAEDKLNTILYTDDGSPLVELGLISNKAYIYCSSSYFELYQEDKLIQMLPDREVSPAYDMEGNPFYDPFDELLLSLDLTRCRITQEGYYTLRIPLTLSLLGDTESCIDIDLEITEGRDQIKYGEISDSLIPDSCTSVIMKNLDWEVKFSRYRATKAENEEFLTSLRNLFSNEKRNECDPPVYGHDHAAKYVFYDSTDTWCGELYVYGSVIEYQGKYYNAGDAFYEAYQDLINLKKLKPMMIDDSSSVVPSTPEEEEQILEGTLLKYMDNGKNNITYLVVSDDNVLYCLESAGIKNSSALKQAYSGSRVHITYKETAAFNFYTWIDPVSITLTDAKASVPLDIVQKIASLHLYYKLTDCDPLSSPVLLMNPPAVWAEAPVKWHYSADGSIVTAYYILDRDGETAAELPLVTYVLSTSKDDPGGDIGSSHEMIRDLDEYALYIDICRYACDYIFGIHDYDYYKEPGNWDNKMAVTLTDEEMKQIIALQTGILHAENAADEASSIDYDELRQMYQNAAESGDNETISEIYQQLLYADVYLKKLAEDNLWVTYESH